MTVSRVPSPVTTHVTPEGIAVPILSLDSLRNYSRTDLVLVYVLLTNLT
jgi:hypothetical protein